MAKIDVDKAAVVEIGPLIDDSDFKTLETAVAYNAAGMSIDLIKRAYGGAITKVDITPTSGGDNDWTYKGNGVYELELTAAQNDTIGTLRVVGVCDGVLPFESPVYETVQPDLHTWYVEKDNGNDSNGGHRWWDAKATISAAITAASDGDTIYIGPGTYDENVHVNKELNIHGAGMRLTTVTSDDDNAIYITGKNSHITDIAGISTADSKMGIKIFGLSGADYITLERCYGEGDFDGIMVQNGNLIQNVRLIDCYGVSKYDGLTVEGGCNIQISGCVGETNGENISGGVHAMFVQGQNVTVDNCLCFANRAKNGEYDLCGLIIRAHEDNLVSVRNTSVYVNHTGTGDHDVYGICSLSNTDFSPVVHISNCNVRVVATAGTVCGFYNKDGKIAIYDTSFTFGSPPGDAYRIYNEDADETVRTFRVTSDNKSVQDYGLVEAHHDKAAKVILNKAVQNKATGAVQYYDDDGQTVILTHTPQDGESQITRMPG